MSSPEKPSEVLPMTIINTGFLTKTTLKTKKEVNAERRKAQYVLAAQHSADKQILCKQCGSKKIKCEE